MKIVEDQHIPTLSIGNNMSGSQMGASSNQEDGRNKGIKIKTKRIEVNSPNSKKNQGQHPPPQDGKKHTKSAYKKLMSIRWFSQASSKKADTAKHRQKKDAKYKEQIAQIKIAQKMWMESGGSLSDLGATQEYDNRL
ncbi:uncharacterized protein G2W53_029033 [Senna tora]|uniref:Uncharacterized protein n=1 Tax=Senna tora TaxID=362788 RepID=A0A834T3F2_9FABA|nr:uncharacterized protein G2W53_029033 [Senna tora]